MRKLLRQIFIVLSLFAVLAIGGCGGGPEQATEEEGKAGMDDMSQYATDPAKPDAAAGGAAAPAEDN